MGRRRHVRRRGPRPTHRPSDRRRSSPILLLLILAPEIPHDARSTLVPIVRRRVVVRRQLAAVVAQFVRLLYDVAVAFGHHVGGFEAAPAVRVGEFGGEVGGDEGGVERVSADEGLRL